MNSIALVISGPAGVGKTTLCDRLLLDYETQLTRVITVTTRHPREGEVGIRKEDIVGRQGGVIPFGYINRIGFDRTLLLGDSGCMVKATTG